MSMRAEKKTRSKLYQLIIVAGLVLVVIFSFGFNVLAPRGKSGMPAKLGTMQLASVTGGQEAMAQVDRLHGLGIELADAKVAQYSHSSPYHSARATVWVGVAKSESAAADLLQRMVEAIGKSGGSGFSNVQKLNVSGHEVYQVDGQGGAHFFFQSREQPADVVWLTVEGQDTMTTLEAALKAF